MPDTQKSPYEMFGDELLVELDKLDKLDKPGGGDAPAPKTIHKPYLECHRFWLRANYEVVIWLPEDLTAREAERLALFFKALVK